jgi:hypothetical protein
VNTGFYLGAGDSANFSITFPQLLSIKAFAGVRLVLNPHALPFDMTLASASVAPPPPCMHCHATGKSVLVPPFLDYAYYSVV